MKTVRTICYWLLVCCIPLLIITTNIRLGVSASGVYEYGFDKYHISQVTGIEELELKKVAHHMTGYFTSKIILAQVTVIKDGAEFNLFNERELVHLQDIRGLIQLDYWIQRGTLFLIMLCVIMLLLWLKDSWRIPLKGLFWGSMFTLGLMGALALWAAFGFDQLFLLFHLVSFSNEFWILDPAKDYLIMLFPAEFFYDITLFGFGAVILEALLIGGTAFGILKARSS